MQTNSGVPPHVVPPEQLSRNCCPRDYWKRPASSGPFPNENPLIGFSSSPDLCLEKGFRPLRRATRGSARLAPLTSGPRKPLKRLDLNFYIIIVPTLCELLYEAVEYRTIYPARLLRLLFSQPSPSIAHICASRATIANWQRKHSASARRSNRWEMYMHNLLYVRVR